MSIPCYLRCQIVSVNLVKKVPVFRLSISCMQIPLYISCTLVLILQERAAFYIISNGEDLVRLRQSAWNVHAVPEVALCSRNFDLHIRLGTENIARHMHGKSLQSSFWMLSTDRFSSLPLSGLHRQACPTSPYFRTSENKRSIVQNIWASESKSPAPIVISLWPRASQLLWASIPSSSKWRKRQPGTQ